MHFLSQVLAALALASPALGQKSHGPYRQNAIYLEKNFNWGGMQNSIQQALEAGYNRFYIGFYMTNYGCQGACLDWQNLGNTKRTNVKNLLKAYSATLYISVGGPGEFWENCINSNCAAQAGSEAGAFAQKYLFDGVELSVKLAGEGTVPSPYADNGQFSQMTQTLATNVKSSGGFTRDQVAVASNAPYFAPEFVDNDITKALSYLALDSNANQPWAISDCNLLMFNEDSNYMTYEDVFVKNTYVDPIYSVFGNGSSVLEIINLGISADHVAVLKPISPNEPTVRSGYVPSAQLGNWGCKAHNSYTWMGGFIGWTWNSASSDEFNLVLKFGNDTLPCD